MQFARLDKTEKGDEKMAAIKLYNQENFRLKFALYSLKVVGEFNRLICNTGLIFLLSHMSKD